VEELMTWAPRVLAWRRGWFAAIRGVISGEHYRRAEELGIRLLKENLSPLQCHQYATSRSFEVVGGTTGRRYRIQHGRLMNIEELDPNGRLARIWCFSPVGGLVTGDILLAQKLALELFELEALAIANIGYS
jgi:hypothetical protein